MCSIDNQCRTVPHVAAMYRILLFLVKWLALSTAGEQSLLPGQDGSLTTIQGNISCEYICFYLETFICVTNPIFQEYAELKL